MIILPINSVDHFDINVNYRPHNNNMWGLLFQEVLYFVGDLPSIMATLYDMCRLGKISPTEKRHEVMRFYFVLKGLLEEYHLDHKVEFIYMKGMYRSCGGFGVGGTGG